MWGSYYNIPKAIFYLLKGDCSHVKVMGPGNPLHSIFQLRGHPGSVLPWLFPGTEAVSNTVPKGPMTQIIGFRSQLPLIL